MTKVVQEIIDDCDKKGYVNHSKSIYISTVYENKQDNTYKTNVKSKINTISGEYQKRNYKLETVESDMETREKAQKAGISTGTYIRNQEMQDQEHEDIKKDEDGADNDAVKEEDPKKHDEEQADKDKQEDVKTDDSEEMQPDQEAPEAEDKEQKEAEREEQGSVQKPQKPDDASKDNKIKEEKDHSFDKEQKKINQLILMKEDTGTAHHVVMRKNMQKNGRDQTNPSAEQKREHVKQKGKGAPFPYRENRHEHTYEQ